MGKHNSRGNTGKAHKSPFLAPSTPRKLVQVSTPGGTSRLVKRESPEVKEHKSTVAGATSNLVNAIVGAGIVGIPYAIKETGLVAGVALVILCAILTEKSLRVLVNTAKHVDVPSYETLFESTYGTFGFYFISINMLIMAYGGCLSYMILIKDTLPVLLGVEADDIGMVRAILTISTMCIILPISMQRDMADLAKTSKISVIFQCAMVMVVVIFAPVTASVEKNGGLQHIISNSVIHTSTLFIGLGVLSFAFVCQHSSFIVAGSLDNPTKGRWSKVTSRALCLCVVLEAACGVFGYLAFMDNTEGDILNNFLDVGGDDMRRASNIARSLLCTTMFFVYPMDSFVCRHVLVVLFFRGRRAHEGDDASVLARRDRRVAVTLVVYLSCLIPAILVDNVGSVLAVTGTIGASSLAYIGPGLVYMAAYGDEFLMKVKEVWDTEKQLLQENDVESSRILPGATPPETTPESEQSASVIHQVVKGATWYLLLMPVWVLIAEIGAHRLSIFRQKEALKSPHINRLGKFARKSQIEMKGPNGADNGALARPTSDHQLLRPVSQTSLTAHGPKVLPYGAILTNKDIGAAIVAKKETGSTSTNATTQGEIDGFVDIDTTPTWWDFTYAIFFVVFGMLALCAGMISIVGQAASAGKP